MDRKTRWRIRWNTFKLNFAVTLLAGIDRKIANEYALWDTAQNKMELNAQRQPEKLLALSHDLLLLSKRCDERVQDIYQEGPGV